MREKLDTRLSIEYTVNDLIVQATDPGHLSAIYVRPAFHCLLPVAFRPWDARLALYADLDLLLFGAKQRGWQSHC